MREAIADELSKTQDNQLNFGQYQNAAETEMVLVQMLQLANELSAEDGASAEFGSGKFE